MAFTAEQNYRQESWTKTWKLTQLGKKKAYVQPFFGWNGSYCFLRVILMQKSIRSPRNSCQTKIKKKIKICETVAHFSLKTQVLNWKQHLCIQMFFSPLWYFFKLFFGCSFEQCTRIACLSTCMYQKGQSTKKSSVFSKPAVTTVNKILLLMKYKVNSSGLKQLLSIFSLV